MTSLITHHGYLAVFLLMLLESACIPIPSEAILLVGGALASGVAIDGRHANLSWVVVALLGVAGNLAGSLISYAAGRYGGRALIEHRTISWLVRPHHLEKADEFFARRGPLAVGLGRLLPVVRTFVSLPAGVAEMPIVPFVAYTVIGCLPWTFVLTFVGYEIGHNYTKVEHAFTPISIVVALALVVGLVTWWRRNRSTQTSDPTLAGDA